MLNNLDDFLKLQDEIWKWEVENFGEAAPARHCFLGIMEETGEFIHAVLKMSQGIRGTVGQHITNMYDAVADIMIYLVNFYRRMNMGYLIPQYDIFLPPDLDKSEVNLHGVEYGSWLLFKAVSSVGSSLSSHFFSKDIPNSIRQIVDGKCQEIVRILISFTQILGCSLAECISDTWNRVVSKRQWVANSATGIVV